MNTFIICLLGLYGVVMLMMCFLQYYTTYSNKKKSINNAHFYVVRFKYNNILYLYLGKPRRDTCKFYACDKGSIVAKEDNFSHFGLNPEDFENLKFEDEPVEVFLNLGD